MLCLITNDSNHGQRLLYTLWARGIAVDAVLYLQGSFAPPAARGAGLAARLARWPRTAASAVRRRFRFRRSRRAIYAMRCGQVVGTGAMNSSRMLRDLRALSPDWIILGGGGIAGAAVIGAARGGVLNAHPALLPWVRGAGVTGASLERGVALGATVHFVDQGIDTGPLIARRLLAVPDGEADLVELEALGEELAAEMMADTVEAIVRRDEAPVGTAQDARYPLARLADDARARGEREALARAGRPQALHRAWLPLCLDAARGTLPARDVEPPSTLSIRPLPRPA